MSQIDTRRIAQNSIVLYIRVIISMLISLITTRVVLKGLGFEDFGIYNVVGGFVVMFNVISGSLSAAISRFITYELGVGDTKRLQVTFRTTLLIQIVVCIIILFFAETIGLWFLNTKMNISGAQLYAANWVYQFSVFALLVDLISVPYNAVIIARERMTVFAYIGILTSVAKLIVAILITLFVSNKLIIYSALLFLVSVSVRIFYGFYCSRNFNECTKGGGFEKNLFFKILNFAGWNFIGSSAGILKDQGLNILLNVFFGPIVNAARGIAVQVSAAANTFTCNFMTALNPQITKSYASADINGSIGLTLKGAKFGYYLMWLISLPILLKAPYILEIWLGDIPEYTVIFVRLVLISALIDTLSNTLMTIMLAHGNIKKYQIAVGGCNLLVLPLAYIFLEMGYNPTSAIIIVVVMSVVTLIVRLFMLRLTMQFPIHKFFKDVLVRIVCVTIVSLPLPLYVLQSEGLNSVVKLLNVCIVSWIVVLICIYILGMTKDERSIVHMYSTKVLNKIRQR